MPLLRHPGCRISDISDCWTCRVRSVNHAFKVVDGRGMMSGAPPPPVGAKLWRSKMTRAEYRPTDLGIGIREGEAPAEPPARGRLAGRLALPGEFRTSSSGGGTERSRAAGPPRHGRVARSGRTGRRRPVPERPIRWTRAPVRNRDRQGWKCTGASSATAISTRSTPRSRSTATADRPGPAGVSDWPRRKGPRPATVENRSGPSA